MKYYVSKSNISLHKEPFDTLKEAEAFCKSWLEENEISSLNDENYTVTKIKYGVCKGYYRNTYKVYAKYKYLHHCPWGANYEHKGERSVLIVEV